VFTGNWKQGGLQGGIDIISTKIYTAIYIQHSCFPSSRLNSTVRISEIISELPTVYVRIRKTNTQLAERKRDWKRYGNEYFICILFCISILTYSCTYHDLT